MYMKWRKELYPLAFRNKLHELEEAEPGSAKQYLEEAGLADPYSIVKEAEGKYSAVPYGIAFADEVRAIGELLNQLANRLSKEKAKDERKAEVTAFQNYFQAFQKAFTCADSVKKEGEWVSVRLWKEVDRAWLKVQGRLQLVHSIESGYGGLDPTETKMIPEFKILLHDESQDAELFDEIKKMKRENAEVLEQFFPEQTKGRLEVIENSLVGPYSMVMGGGNSLDNIGVAQIGPNYNDVASQGVKSFLDAASFAENDEKKDTVVLSIFGEKAAEGYFSSTQKNNPLLMAEFVASHEISHPVLGDLGTLDELNATWMGLVALFEREKKGLVSPELAEAVMKEHVIGSLKYMVDSNHEDRYFIEGWINAKLMVACGLVKKADGHFSFHAEKMAAFREVIEATWKEMIALFLEKGKTAEKKWEKYTKTLQKCEGEMLASVNNLMRLAEEGMQAYNEAKKAEILELK